MCSYRIQIQIRQRVIRVVSTPSAWTPTTRAILRVWELTDDGDEDRDRLLVGASNYHRISVLTFTSRNDAQKGRTSLAPSIGSAGRSSPTSENPCFSIKYFKTVRFPAEGVPTIAINIPRILLCSSVREEKRGRDMLVN